MAHKRWNKTQKKYTQNWQEWYWWYPENYGEIFKITHQEYTIKLHISDSLQEYALKLRIRILYYLWENQLIPYSKLCIRIAILDKNKDDFYIFYLAVIFIQSTESNFPEADVKNPMQGSLGYLNKTFILSKFWKKSKKLLGSLLWGFV